MKARLYQLSGAGAGSYELVTCAGELHSITPKHGGGFGSRPLGKVGAAWCAPNGARLLTKIPGFLKHIFFSLNKQA